MCCPRRIHSCCSSDYNIRFNQWVNNEFKCIDIFIGTLIEIQCTDWCLYSTRARDSLVSMSQWWSRCTRSVHLCVASWTQFSCVRTPYRTRYVFIAKEHYSRHVRARDRSMSELCYCGGTIPIVSADSLCDTIFASSVVFELHHSASLIWTPMCLESRWLRYIAVQQWLNVYQRFIYRWIAKLIYQLWFQSAWIGSIPFVNASLSKLQCCNGHWTCIHAPGSLDTDSAPCSRHRIRAVACPACYLTSLSNFQNFILLGSMSARFHRRTCAGMRTWRYGLQLLCIRFPIDSVDRIAQWCCAYVCCTHTIVGWLNSIALLMIRPSFDSYMHLSSINATCRPIVRSQRVLRVTRSYCTVSVNVPCRNCLHQQRFKSITFSYSCTILVWRHICTNVEHSTNMDS